ncbi:MAG TPA: glutamine--fructose-6-phosphate transaminase (isomerizing) [Spirochaetota bacterium]|nr:glutamine--fructose-6-phosphate transaminase (isomerizing) [Spirochaetota bacterium]HOM37794.1 glutamine--fructose-6-phosphate transaminase (isomerizing) [Spirochaetota bacterium]HPQ49329.1 glutamine--fructose-6-phosphate transaminase (isomerizing) [Spirochaetota bacterium]
MCGIVGYTGNKKAKDILISGLKNLEYRGYDSAGICLQENNELLIFKDKGRIKNLITIIDGLSPNAISGIGHTRWATHGEPNQINSHPHTDCKNSIAIVHNGIIENYTEIKKFLESKGHIFKSETDSEVISHLIEEFYEGDFKEAFLNMLKIIEGAYAILAMDKNTPNTIIGARKGSPLILGIGNNENFLVSDPSAIVGYTANVVYLDDGEVVIIKNNEFEILDPVSKKSINKKVEHISWSLKEISKDGYPDFMLKEIFEQQQTIKNAFRGRISIENYDVKLGGLKLTPKDIQDIQRVFFISCGTSWHAGIYAKYVMEDLSRIISEHEYASEFRYRNPLIKEDDIFFFISQSGETADTLAALKLVKQLNGRVYGITNVVGSSIAREAGQGVYTHAGPEIGVASTKAFTSQLVVTLLIALYFGKFRKTVPQDKLIKIIEDLNKLPDIVENFLKKNIEILKSISFKYKDISNALYLGRGLNFPIALEGALKLKEISYIHAEGYPAAEMKHGPIALIDKNFPVFVIATRELYEKVISNIEEVKARGAKVVAIANEGDKKITKLADDVIFVPELEYHVQPIINVIPLQLIAYYIASFKGKDVDKPRNLAKSVTVE